MKLRQWNWWKIGFFVALFAFEITREIAVVASYESAMVGPSIATTYRSPDGAFVTAEGRWEHPETDERGIPAAVTIQCRREIHQCVIASEIVMFARFVPTPDVGTYDATFTDTGAEFLADGICTALFVRVDAVHNMTMAVNTPKPNATGCPNDNHRVLLRLGGFSAREYEEERGGHFIPLIDAIGGVLRFLGVV